MKKLFVLMLTGILFSVAANAQEEESSQGYKDAVGVRLSSSTPAVSSGISYKHFFGNNAVEGILSFNNGGALCALYEIHKPLNVANLQWLIGFGGYVGFGKTSNLGAAGIVGLDYKFDQLPINVSLDWKPELNIVSKVGFEASGVGLSARFTF